MHALSEGSTENYCLCGYRSRVLSMRGLEVDMVEAARGLLEGERDYIANAANLSALLFQTLRGVNWAGFYFMREGRLVLGPFQGKPACTSIELGDGVCGAAAQSRQTVVVDDVKRFPKHITCDPESKSEIVVPLIVEGQVVGVLDVDSHLPSRFDDRDRSALEAVVKLYLGASDFAPPLITSRR
ncbi:MAG: GAF domain-containing protein [Candidatus Baltobacteraceae bacterium]|jgi:GAF domain-containing protein